MSCFFGTSVQLCLGCLCVYLERKWKLLMLGTFFLWHMEKAEISYSHGSVYDGGCLLVVSPCNFARYFSDVKRSGSLQRSVTRNWVVTLHCLPSTDVCSTIFTTCTRDLRTIVSLISSLLLLFRFTNFNIGFKSDSAMGHRSKPKKSNNWYNNTGIYLLKCETRPLKYFGQTGRSFKTRFREHI
jgi:hypothetical protein